MTLPLSSLALIEIDLQKRGIPADALGTPLLMGYHTHYLDRARAYSSLDEMVADGFEETDPLYLMAEAMIVQGRHPASWVVGRRALPPTQTIDLTPTVTTEGFVYSIKIGGETATVTVGASASVATICDELVIAINALSGAFTATDGTTKVTVAANAAGSLFTYTGAASDGSVTDWPRELTFRDVTTDPGVATDLTAIRAVNDAWDVVMIDSQSAAELTALSTAVEALTAKTLCATNGDSINGTSSTTDVISVAKAATRDRTKIMATRRHGIYVMNGLVGKMLPLDAGSENWHGRTIKGFEGDDWNTTELNYILNKNGCVYAKTGTTAVTHGGKATSGEWFDNVRGRDWLQGALETAWLNFITANDSKIPITDKGIAAGAASLQGPLNEAVKRNLAKGGEDYPQVIAPKASEVTTTDRENRRVPYTFVAKYASSVNTASVKGSLTY